MVTVGKEGGKVNTDQYLRSQAGAISTKSSSCVLCLASAASNQTFIVEDQDGTEK
jgi:hypothetical protein